MELFNLDIKQKYLENNHGKAKIRDCGSFFASIAYLEWELNKDVAMFSAEELARFFAENNYYNITTIRTKISDLRNYRFWYNDNVDRCIVRFDEDEIISRINLEEIQSKNLFFSIEEILQSVDRDLHRNGDINAQIFILGWYGLDKKQCFNLKKTDVTEGKNGEVIVRTPDKTIVVAHRRCAEILKEYGATREFVRTGQKNKTIFRQSNDVYYFRNYYAQKVPTEVKPMEGGSFHPIRSGLVWSADGKRLAFQEVQFSGSLFRIHQDVKSGMAVEEAVKKEYPDYVPWRIQGRIQSYELYAKRL